MDISSLARQLGVSFKSLRSEFFEKTLEALRWNIDSGKLVMPLARVKLEDEAELATMAFQQVIAVPLLAEASYLSSGQEQEFISRLSLEVAGPKTPGVYPFLAELNAHIKKPDELICSFALHIVNHISAGTPGFQVVPAAGLVAQLARCFCLRIFRSVAHEFNDTEREHLYSQQIEEVRLQGRGY